MAMSVKGNLPGSGILVVIEGVDRVGKSTQLAAVAERLAARGIRVRASREPGGDELGERIRELIFGYDMDAQTELLLFLAARARHLKNIIRPAKEAGELVLVDRYTPSTLVYQGETLGVAIVDHLMSELGFDTPDLTIILDRVSPLAELSDGDRFEAQDRWSNRRFRYLELAGRYGWPVIEAGAAPEAVTDAIVERLAEAGVI